MRPIILILTLGYLLQGAVVIDRMAAIAGKHVIKTSDIERDLRLTEFLNRQPLSVTADGKRKSADRLIDQAIIRDEIATGQYRRANDSDAAAMLEQIRKERFGGSDARLRQTLSQYRLTEEELKAQLLWQLTVLRFIDQRFGEGVSLTDEDIRNYYDQHLAELKRQYPNDNSFEALQPRIRSILQGQRVNEEFESWLDGARKRQHIEYRQGALE
jgi:peptidyl-prolyl cis-trans isomerase SurA